MLTVSQVQLDRMAVAAFMRRLREFLLQRSMRPDLSRAASSAGGCETLWRPLLPSLVGQTEYEMAVRLSYALACSVHGADPNTALVRGEVEMKNDLEAWGALRFSEFDL